MQQIIYQRLQHLSVTITDNSYTFPDLNMRSTNSPARVERVPVGLGLYEGVTASSIHLGKHRLVGAPCQEGTETHKMCGLSLDDVFVKLRIIRWLVLYLTNILCH